MSEAPRSLKNVKVTLLNPAPDADAPTEVWSDADFRAAWAASAAEDHARDLFDDDVEASMEPWLFDELSTAPDRLPEPLRADVDTNGDQPASAPSRARQAADPEAPFAAVYCVEAVTRAARRAAAAQDLLFTTILAQAAGDPVPWVGADPTLDPAWRDPRGWSVATVREHRRSLAIRSAAADIGLRAHLSDNQVRNRAHRAHVLQTRCPRTWVGCLEGDVSEQNMTIAADVANSLPADAPSTWAALDDAVAEPAATMVPGRFRLRARSARERVHHESLRERHARAAEKRCLDVSPEFDGMATLTALLPATNATRSTPWSSKRPAASPASTARPAPSPSCAPTSSPICC